MSRIYRSQLYASLQQKVKKMTQIKEKIQQIREIIYSLECSAYPPKFDHFEINVDNYTVYKLARCNITQRAEIKKALKLLYFDNSYQREKQTQKDTQTIDQVFHEVEPSPYPNLSLLFNK